jgi:transcriptional regulator with XRE-family HTH domain
MLKQSWQPEDGLLLKELRQNAKLEIYSLAQIYCISNSQVIQLEEGGERGFYSADIKFSLGKKLLLHFGHHIKTIPITAFIDPLLMIQNQSVSSVRSFWRLQFIWLIDLLKITDTDTKNVTDQRPVIKKVPK